MAASINTMSFSFSKSSVPSPSSLNSLSLQVVRDNLLISKVTLNYSEKEMAHLTGRSSTLNPNAPIFVPTALRQVEDFSPEWWQLVTTSTWYHDYWLSQHQGADGFYDNAEDDLDNGDIADLLPETFDLDASEYFSNLGSQFDEVIQPREVDPAEQYNGGMKKDDETLRFLKGGEKSVIMGSQICREGGQVDEPKVQSAAPLKG